MEPPPPGRPGPKRSRFRSRRRVRHVLAAAAVAVSLSASPASGFLLRAAPGETPPRRFSPSFASSGSGSSEDRLVAAAGIGVGAEAEARAEASAAVPREEEEEIGLYCRACGAGPFPSRNVLFRHLREDPTCSGGGAALPASAAARKKKRTAVVLVGYYAQGGVEVEDGGETQSPTPTPPANELTGKIVERAFREARRRLLSTPEFDNLGDESSSPRVGGADDSAQKATLASAARLRHPVLGQEVGCRAAAGDVVGIDYHETKAVPPLDDATVLTEMRAVLADNDRGGGSATLGADVDVRVLGLTSLPASTKFHAERSCTQRVYRYLLPLRWLDGGEGVEAWWLRQLEQRGRDDDGSGGGGTPTGHQPRGAGGGPPDALRRLKAALKLAEGGDAAAASSTAELSPAPSGDGGASDPEPSGARAGDMGVASPGRFGSLWRKVRRPLHHFADPPSFPGQQLSPTHTSVWRAVDRCRVADFVTYRSPDGSESVVAAAVEMRGDSFLAGQVRRIVGSAVAVANGWVPPSFFAAATRADDAGATSGAARGGEDDGLAAPAAPLGRAYAAGSRFHFAEMERGGRELFDDDGDREGGVRVGREAWVDELHSRMLSDLDSESTRREESRWLRELEEIASPRINARLGEIAVQDKEQQRERERAEEEREKGLEDGRIDRTDFSEPPPEYRECLSILRNIAREGSWPPTSGARLRYLRSPRTCTSPGVPPPLRRDAGGGFMASSFPGDAVQAGSFTVVNEAVFDAPPPAGNALFPELARAVFALEDALIRGGGDSDGDGDGYHDDDDRVRVFCSPHRRAPSTHCAIDRNAEYAPHVEKGREGAPSTLHVGMGNYAGGELVVEGGTTTASPPPLDLRYRPRAYDGGERRQWTTSFDGERYSLTWFTPPGAAAAAGDDAAGWGSSPNRTAGATREDLRAELLAEEHAAARFPALAPLTFRRNSTDALAVQEILDPRHCVYELTPSVSASSPRAGGNGDGADGNSVWEDGFSVAGHESVFDVGAHIGVFARYALGKGARRVVAFEPEPDNLDLLRTNLAPLLAEERAAGRGGDTTDGGVLDSPVAEIRAAAVSQGAGTEGGWADLVLARGRNDGTLNTWRHALERHCSYVDRTEGSLPSSAQEGTLIRARVRTVPLLGEGGALERGVTFVKLDCEGAEMDVLLSEEAANAESWMDVTHLVVEWSFTKERRVEQFHRAMRNIESAGFRVRYDGKGSWWDTESSVVWPFHTDLCVFAKRLAV